MTRPSWVTAPLAGITKGRLLDLWEAVPLEHRSDGPSDRAVHLRCRLLEARQSYWSAAVPTASPASNPNLSVRHQPRPRQGAPVSCLITASEVDAWLATLPPPELAP